MRSDHISSLYVLSEVDRYNECTVFSVCWISSFMFYFFSYASH